MIKYKNIIFIVFILPISLVQISYSDNKDGTVGVTYLPTEPGDYKISVRFGDKHIKGSPYTSKVIGDHKRNQVSIESCTSVTLPGLLTDADLKTLNAIIQVELDSIFFEFTFLQEEIVRFSNTMLF